MTPDVLPKPTRGSGATLKKPLPRSLVEGFAMNFRLVSRGLNIDMEVDPVSFNLLLPSCNLQASGGQTLPLALANPDRYPHLEQCVTPDDRVAIAVDSEGVNNPDAVRVVVDRLKTGGVLEGNVSLVLGMGCEPVAEQRLRSELSGIRIVRHDPDKSDDSCYLATLRNGKRVYLNRELLESDFQVFIGSPSRGVNGSLVGSEVQILAGLIVPQQVGVGLDSKELEEVGTLLGTPYFLSGVTGGGSGGTTCWWAGGWESAKGAKKAHREAWRARAKAESDLVVVAAGESGEDSFGFWCQVMRKASKLVRDQGQIILVAGNSQLDLAPWEAFFERAGEPGELLENVRLIPRHLRCVGWWARAAEKARIQVVSGLPDDVVTGMFAHPLAPDKVSGLVQASRSVALIGDFSKAIVGAPIL
jgi:hypothetical protein